MFRKSANLANQRALMIISSSYKGAHPQNVVFPFNQLAPDFVTNKPKTKQNYVQNANTPFFPYPGGDGESPS